MSDTDPTPNTPVTIGDRLGWWRGDLAARLITLGGQLDTLTTELQTTRTTLAGKLDAVVTAINGLVLGGDNTALIEAIAALRGTGTGNNLKAIHDLLALSNNALGAAPQSSLELATVRGFLAALVLNAGNFGQAPGGDLNGIAQGLTSIAVNGRRYIVWPGIDGVVVSNEGIDLTPGFGWDGWQIYIQTDAPDATLHDRTTPAASIEGFPVNSWVDLGGSATFAISVDSSYQVRGFLRDTSPGAEIITLQSAILNEGGGQQQFALWPEQFSPVTYAGGPTLAITNLYGWHIRAHASSALNMKYRLTTDDDSVTRDASMANNVWFEWLQNTRLVFFVRQPADGTFTVDLWPPNAGPPPT